MPSASYRTRTPYRCGLLSLLHLYRTFIERQSDARRRLLLLDTGTVVSLIPVIFLAFVLAGRRNFADWVAALPTLGFRFYSRSRFRGAVIDEARDHHRGCVRKGIPAALLMPTLRASLRGQTIGAEMNLAEPTVNLNSRRHDTGRRTVQLRTRNRAAAPASRVRWRGPHRLEVRWPAGHA